ncbi:hypothetical protein [Pseudomonas sp. UBA1879]|uniref:hypothetical protein n=1 Tax=Pseudomonas sp. UBA1879 TaxID=1947305 RepID=UPI0025CF3EFD|nr:hypothetical protein [Pseudomonas sp. UBA1879]
MPAQTTPPLIPELPPAPSRSEGQAAFNLTAGPFIAAMPPMVVNINTSLAWIGQQVTAVDGYRQAAATSASNAADSASAANTSKNAAAQSATDATNNGKAQLDLTKAQVTLAAEQAALATTNGQAQVQLAAQQAQLATTNGQAQVAAAGQVKDQTAAIRDQAQIIADAARAAVGIPSYTNKKGYVFTVSDDGASIQWRPRHRVGEVVQVSGALDNTFLPLTGGIYLQSAYPALFAKVGILGSVAGDVWSTPTVNPETFRRVAAGSGVQMATAFGQVSTIYRSTNDGQTWNAISLTALLNTATASVYDVATDGKGVWIAIGYVSSLGWFTLRSPDNGVTWAKVTTPNLPGLPTRLATDKNGTWIATGGTSSVTIARSLDNGLTWAVIVSGVGSNGAGGAATDGLGNWIVAGAGAAYISTNNGASFAAKSYAVGLTITTAYDVVTDSKGLWMVTFNTSSGLGLIKTYNLGVDWSLVTVTGLTTSTVWCGVTDGDGNWFFGATSGRFFYTRDNGQTWTVVPSGTTKVGTGDVVAVLLLVADLVITAGTNQNRSYAATPYDSTTLFRLPNVTVFKGLTSYIKAKEAA